MGKWAGCQSKDEAIEHAKEEIEKSKNAPIALYERELEQNGLKTKYYKAAEGFPDVRNEDDPTDAIRYEEFRVVTNAIIDMGKKYGFTVAFYTIHDLFGKMEQRRQALLGLHVCPCCTGEKTHIVLVREEDGVSEEIHDCKTCDSAGKLDF
jgi:hypothetical protein